MRPCRVSSSLPLSTSPAAVAGTSGRCAAVASVVDAFAAWELPLSSSTTTSSRRRRLRQRRRRHQLQSLSSSSFSTQAAFGALNRLEASCATARHALSALRPYSLPERGRRRGQVRVNARSVGVDDSVDIDYDDGDDDDDVSFSSSSSFRGTNDAPELGGRLVQWYPGHIARAERRLKEALGKVDVVLEVLDARCPSASRHPSLGSWCGGGGGGGGNHGVAGVFVGGGGGASPSSSSSPVSSSSSADSPPPPPIYTGKPRILVLNRCDQVSAADRREWDEALRRHVTGGVAPIWTDGARGTGIALLKGAALAAAARANAGRARRGLAPRPARAVVVGLPNVGKSAIINRLLGRRVAPSAPRPGVTRDLRWCRLRGRAAVAASGTSSSSSSSSFAPSSSPISTATPAAAAAAAPTYSLDLLDAPGIVPPSLRDQRAAARLAACNDIGQAAYLESAVAAELIDTLMSLPSSRGLKAVEALEKRLRVPTEAWETAEDFLSVAASGLFRGDIEQAGARVLKDYRNGALGAVALEDAREWSSRREARGAEEGRQRRGGKK